jgi:hypothetical protein
MASDDFESEEVDRLVSELAAPLKPLMPVAVDVPTPTPPAPPPAILVPGRRWTTARLHMPAARAEPRAPRAFLSAITLPRLPSIPFPKFDDASGVLSARVFVALGVLLSAAMPYWP